jgi:transcriptional regulator with XRE-family HTH domain
VTSIAAKEKERLKEQDSEGERVQRSGRAILRALRSDAGYTREGMARRLGIKLERVRDLETGRREIRLDDPARWAIATGADPLRVVQQIISWKELSKTSRR